jgi:hypothetical protein
MAKKRTRPSLILIFLSILIGILLSKVPQLAIQKEQAAGSETTKCIWEVCSIDTMKTSRDRARSELSNEAFNTTIEQEVMAIKNTGANYIAIDTPYDDEFLPFLERWVKYAREYDLHVWFRGNWSNWEGWFDHPRDMTPAQHLVKTKTFIIEHPTLFVDEDIFEACPECENTGYWPQPEKDQQYNDFIQAEVKTTHEAFTKINKHVYSHYVSIIGGRAREVLTKETIGKLNNIVTIDHYIRNPKQISEYFDYFSSYGARVLLSENGAPIPSLHGQMDDDQQATYLQGVLDELYVKKDTVLGYNYWVISQGTTQLVTADGTPRKSYTVLQQYFLPFRLTGRITDTAGTQLTNIALSVDGGITYVKTDANGVYHAKSPYKNIRYIINDENYRSVHTSLAAATPGEEITKDFVLTPAHPSLFYNSRIFFTKLLHH